MHILTNTSPRGAAAAALLFTLAGCFIPAPIEEEPPEPDEPPTFQVNLDLDPNPLTGNLQIDLSSQRTEVLAIERIDDPNEDQILYARALIYFDATLLTEIVIGQTQILPESRRLGVLLDFCEAQLEPSLVDTLALGGGATLYVAVSDEPFVPINLPQQAQSLFQTESDRPVQIATWTIEFFESTLNSFPDICDPLAGP